jgi:hypothetical protein
VCPDAGCDHSRFLVVLTRIPDWYANGCCHVPRTEFCYFKQPTPTFLSAISAIMFHAKTYLRHMIYQLNYGIECLGLGKVMCYQQKISTQIARVPRTRTAYLRGTW